ncbi:MAG: NADH-quinone oxidoreductase subunit NuoN [Sulfuricella sp.]|nr:NADH-quinone oxidoreductase subunit NuoN [Gammaproteobacteria bacterium]
MTIAVPNLMPALPEIFVLTMASLILVVDLFLSGKNRFISYVLTQLTLLGAAWITVSTGSLEVTHTFSGMFVDDVMADVLKMMTYITVSVMLVYSRGYLQLRNLFQGEFFVLLLFAMLGMMVMISASHFLTLYLGLELLSLALYAMVALQRDSSPATEAAMKYFILGALASGLLLYGMSMIYGATGSLDLGNIAAAIQQGTGSRTVLIFGLVFIVAGLAFKLGAVPFHMWVPDVYQGSPTAVTLFIGSAPKIAAFAFIMRLLVEGLPGMMHDWQGMLIVMAVLSMAIGNITAIAQTNIKRMLAYSTISHMGFLLLGFISGSLNGYSASMFYVLAYVLMNLGSFGMILLLSRQGFEAENIDDFKGLNQRKPWYAFLMLLVMFSMAGVPPTVGFYAKLSVLQAALQAGFLWVVVFAVLMSVIGAYYYLRIVKVMYFDAPQDQTPIAAQPDISMLLSVNGMAVLALGILPQPLMALCAYSIQHSLL